jgi:hypothetical protein
MADISGDVGIMNALESNDNELQNLALMMASSDGSFDPVGTSTLATSVELVHLGNTPLTRESAQGTAGLYALTVETKAIEQENQIYPLARQAQQKQVIEAAQKASRGIS